MGSFLLAVWLVLIFVRPMDWWNPVLGWELVNLTAIATLLVSIGALFREFKQLWRIPQVKLLFGLLVGVTLSGVYPFFWSVRMQTAFQDFGKLFVMFVLILLWGSNPTTFRLLLWSVLLSTAWMAIHGILQIQTGKGFGGLPPLDRNSDGSLYQIVAFGIFNDPNDLCLVFIAGIPFLYAEFRTASQFIFKLLALMLVPLFTYAAWLTNSRGGVLGILGMMGAHAIVSTHGIRRWIFSAIGVVTIMIFAPSRFSGGFSRETDRLILWGDGINLFQRYPLFGTGYNTFPDYSSTYQVAHNSYIQILAETGILGYFFYIFLIFITIIQLRRASNLKKEALVATDRAYLGACFSSLVGYLTSCYFLSRQYNAVFYVLFALTTCRILITCRDSQLSQRIVGLWKRDLKYGTLFSLVSIPGLWIIVRFGNTTLR